MIFKQDLKFNKNIFFYQIIGFGFLFFIFGVYVWKSLFPKLFLIGQSLLGNADDLCGCGGNLSFKNSTPALIWFIFSGILLVFLVGYVLFIFFKVKFTTGKFIKNILKNKKDKISNKLFKIVEDLKLTNKVLEIESQKPVVFCFGFLRPKICISSLLVDELNDDELRAVLLHEKCHLVEYEPLRIFLLRVIMSIGFFFPVLKNWLAQYLVFTEMGADRFATNNWQNKIPLANSLYKVINLQGKNIAGDNLALSFFSVTDQRINKLADEKYFPEFRILTIKFFSSIISVLVLFMSVFGLINYAQPVMASGANSNTCFMMDNGMKVGCHEFLKKQKCSLANKEVSYLDGLKACK